MWRSWGRGRRDFCCAVLVGRWRCAAVTVKRCGGVGAAVWVRRCGCGAWSRAPSPSCGCALATTAGDRASAAALLLDWYGYGVRPSTHVLDSNRNELILSCIGGPPCWKRGCKFRQIDDNRWSAIRQGGVPRARNSLTWGFAGAFFSLRPACRKTARFAPCDHRLSCVCPNSGAFSQQPPLESPVASSQRQPPPPRIPSAVRAFACRGWLRAIARRVFRLGPLS